MNTLKTSYRALIALLLVSGILVAATPVLAATGFQDVTDGHWAARYISRMSALEVIRGYSDGTFRPDQAVTELEALIMAARCKSSTATITAPLPFAVPAWAEQDIARALALGLLKNDDAFFPEAAATRAWVTRLLVRLIGKEGEALGVQDPPAFTDSYLIPSWAAGYVKVARDNKLISGYPDNSFRPDAAVTRAEMAVFLGRVQELMPAVAGVISGSVLEVTLDYLTISTAGGEKHTFRVAYDVPAYDEYGPISLLSLQRLDRVSLVVEGDRIKYLEKLAAAPIATTVSGNVRRVYPEMKALVVEVPGGEYRTFYVRENASTPVTGSSGPGLDSLQPGDEVAIDLDVENYITAITVLARQQGAVNEGLVYDLDPAAALITLQAENGNLSSYRLAGQVSVIMAGQRFPTLGDLCRGDRVRVTVENYAVTTIEVLEIASRRDISGTVVAIASDSRVLTLEANGNLEAYRVTGTAEIIVPGLAKAVLADVVKGDEVQVRVEKGEIIRLEVRSREVGDKLTGTVVGVDTGNKILTIKVENDELRAYRVKDNARIVVNGEEKSLSYVEKDMRASVRLVNGEIIFLDVDNSLAGTVVDLDKEGRLLVIQDSEGGRETYVIAKNADVESRDDRDELGEIRKGDYVEITVEDDVVTAIKIRTAFILRVEDVREAWDRIDAEDEDGDNFRLYVRDGVELVVPGIDYPDVDDVQEGDIIKATYLGDDLEKVEVLEPRRGRVTEVNSYTRTVTVAYYDGTTAILEFNSNSEVIKDSTHYSSLGRLAAGDRVEVLENIEGGYTFKVMKVISGILAFNGEEDQVYLKDNYEGWRAYDLSARVYVHGASGTLSPVSLHKDQRVRLYMLDNLVYEIEVL